MSKFSVGDSVRGVKETRFLGFGTVEDMRVWHNKEVYIVRFALFANGLHYVHEDALVDASEPITIN